MWTSIFDLSYVTFAHLMTGKVGGRCLSQVAKIANIKISRGNRENDRPVGNRDTTLLYELKRQEYSICQAQ